MPHLTPAQQRALLATARIAGLAALVACGPKQQAPPTEPPLTARSEVVPPAPTDDARPSAALETSEPLDLETCEATVEEALGGKGLGNGVGKVSERTLDCCELLLGDGQRMGTARWGCCQALQESGRDEQAEIGMSCTPWGPPSPPAMRGVA